MKIKVKKVEKYPSHEEIKVMLDKLWEMEEYQEDNQAIIEELKYLATT